MDIDSIIFDLDGTLWDSTDAVLKAWNEVLKDKKEIRQPVTREMLHSIMGMQVKEIGVKLFPYMNEEQQNEIMELCLEREKEILLVEGGVLYPKLELILDTLSKKYSLFIVSNCECGYIETFLEHHKLGKYFKDIECAGNTGLVKGKNIKRIMDRNNIKQAVYVGDTQGDCDAARLAEVPFVFASYGFGKVNSYDFIINEIEDILEFVM
jgi:phosphoglycolate phosphatase